jgi:hypothetical protein
MFNMHLLLLRLRKSEESQCLYSIYSNLSRTSYKLNTQYTLFVSSHNGWMVL